MSDKIKVLIADDSKIYRNFLAKSIESENDIEIIGSMFNGKKAIEFIENNQRPDVVTLDIEMPELDGLGTLKKIMEINSKTPNLPPIGVIMVSSHTQRGADVTMECLKEGAFDFITKMSDGSFEENIDNLRKQLAAKLRVFFYRKNRKQIGNKEQIQKIKVRTPQGNTNQEIKAIVIGCSTGGPQTLANFLPDLTTKTDLPIFIVQHMPPSYTKSLADSLNQKCKNVTIKEAEHREMVMKKHVYIAQGGKHLVLEKNTFGKVILKIIDTPPENNCKPAVDVLFRSSALLYGKHQIAIVLTGMGNDGTKGLVPIKRKGGYIILQDENTSIVWGMPGSAHNAGLGDELLPLKDITTAVVNKINRGKNGK